MSDRRALPAQPDAALAARRIVGGVEAVVGAIVGALLATLLVVVTAGVVLRYGLGTSLFGAEELALWLFAALVFLGLPLQHGSVLAMRLDLLTGRLGARGRSAARLLADGVTAHAALVLVSGGLAILERLGGTSTTLGLPEWIRYAPVVAGASIMLALLPLRGLGEGRLAGALVALLLGAAMFGLSHAGVLVRIDAPSLVAGGTALLFLVLGAPLPAALLSALSLAIPLGALLPEAAIVQNTVSGFSKMLLLAVPFFLLASVLMQEGGLGGRLVRFARALVGHRRGGIGQTTLVTNVLFSGVSGSSIADAAFGAKVLAPGLREAGYGPARATAIVAATAVLPNIIPPSIAFLILAHAANLSVGALFTGGLVGGLVFAAALAFAIHSLGGAERARAERATSAERLAALRGALPVFGLAAVILLGIRFGVVTPTEAAAVAAIYALLFNLATGGPVVAAFIGAGRETAAIGLLIGTAAPFVFLLAVDGIPAATSGLLVGLGIFGLLLAANAILLLAGAVLDIGAAILLLAPLLVPAAMAVGIDPVAFGVLLVANLMIGGLTPPFGILVYVASGLSGVSAAATFRASLPLVLALLLALAAMSIAVGLSSL